jgi:predicted flap endonuclease-1-like 5' DNA nuclease
MVVQSQETKDRAKATGSKILDGAALVVVSPIVVPALLLRRRLAAKALVRGSLSLVDKVKLLATKTSEGWSQWVAEARSEVQTATAPSPVEAIEEVTESQSQQSTTETVENQPQQTEEMSLQQLTGVDSKFADLLREAGVESVHALTENDAANLHEKLMQINEQQQIVREVPSVELLTYWITQAQHKEN